MVARSSTRREYLQLVGPGPAIPLGASGARAIPAQSDESADFEGDRLTPDSAHVIHSGVDDVILSAGITSTGSVEGTQDVLFLFDDETFESQAMMLGPDDTAGIEFASPLSSDVESGDYQYAISTEDGIVGGTLTVEAVEPAQFAGSSLQPGELTADIGSIVSVSATVENTGGKEGTQTVSLDVEEPVAADQQRELTFSAGKDTTEEVGFEVPELNESPPVTYTIASANDSESGKLPVQPDESEDDCSTTTVDDSDDSTTSESSTDGSPSGRTDDGVGLQKSQQYICLGFA